MARRSTSETLYSKLVRESGLNSAEIHGWSGRGSHVEFKSEEDVPLKLGKILGRGAYAVVQKVVCKDRRPLAQKVIVDYNTTGLNAIMSEVKHIQCLRHQHLIQLVGTYVVGCTLHILLFPVGQWNLRSFLKEFKDPKTNRKALPAFYNLGTFFKCLAHAVAYLHDEVTPRIKHLDIKPENAIVRQYAAHGLTVLLTDFGVSRSFQPTTTSQDRDTLYTTPMYAAPEVAERKPFGRPADIFSLGCVYSEMASVLGDKTLLQYENHRRSRENGTETIAFERNLSACKSWLQSLQANVPFRQLSIQDPVWWTRLLRLIEKMLSERASDRPTSAEVIDDFPRGPCCGLTLKEFETPKAEEDVDGNPGTASPNAVTQLKSPAIREPFLNAPTAALQSISLSPQTQPSIPHIENESRDAAAATEFDWSGKGAHVGYGTKEQVPLEILDRIAIGSSSLVEKVRSTRRGPYIFAKKSLQKSGHLLGLEMLLQEVKVLQNLQNPHIVRLVGTIDEKRFFSLLSYPAAKWNLRTFMESIPDLHAEDPELHLRKSALQIFYKCLIQGLNYLHSQNVRHKDIKPSNILVHQLRNDGYHVYLADFGLSTRFDRRHGSQTTGLTGHTPMYASPEVLSTSTRGRASDIFSMGCVWLEMYTVLLGERLEELESYRVQTSESSSDDLDDIDSPASNGDFSSFAASLPKVRTWVERLIFNCDMHKSLMSGDAGNFPGLNISCNEIIEGLHNVEQMLQENPSARPDAPTLCQKLGANPCCNRDVAPFEIAEGFTGVETSTTIASQQLKAVTTLPYRRDEDFVGRKSTILEVGKLLAEPQTLRRIALIGLGGVGKSQIAIEYAYQLREKYPRTHVFWVYAHSSVHIEQSYRAIAKAVKLPGVEDPRIDILGLVFEWLESDISGDWLMILDNADDTSIFFPYQATHMTKKFLSTYLPQNPRGVILITSRNKNAAWRLTGRPDRIIEIGKMNEEEAKLLLQAKLPNDRSSEEDRMSLVQTLECLPLAITQAAAYIARHTPRMTIPKYLKIFNNDERNQIHLLSIDKGDLRRDPGVPNSVLITWQISFEQIKTHNPRAAELLSLMCVLDRKRIPSYLFCDDNEDNNQLDFLNAVETLVEFSLVRAHMDNDSFEMHPLVQLSIREWLQSQDEIDRIRERTLHLLSERFPSGEYVNWKICEDLEPHAQTILGYSYVSTHCQLERAKILHNSAWWRLTQGDYGIAEVRVREAVDIREKMLGPHHSCALNSLHLLALVFDYEGRYGEAEKLNLQVLERRTEVLGKEHPETLTSVNNLASTYRAQGRYEEAEKLNLQVLEMTTKILGKEHPETLTSGSNLASIYRNQGRYMEAEELNLQVLEMRTKILGQKHPDTLTSMASLTSTLQDQGKYEAAEEMNRRALEGSMEVLGAEHPSTLVSMANLASIFRSQRRYKAAEEINQRALEGYVKVLGAEHPDTLASMTNLASTLQDQGKYEAAEEMNRRALEGSMEVLGAEHPSTLISMANLASIFRSQRRYKAAEEINQRALEGYVKVLGAEHPDTLASMTNLASTLQDQGKYEAAEEMNRRALEGYTRMLGAEHPYTLASMANLVSISRSQRKDDLADSINEHLKATRKH